MNGYIADQIAREHADRLMSDAAAARRARRVIKARRATRTTRTSPAADLSRSAVARPGTTAAHFVARPFIAVRSWLVAGEL
jgi:hypothetical protein